MTDQTELLEPGYHLISRKLAVALDPNLLGFSEGLAEVAAGFHSKGLEVFGNQNGPWKFVQEACRYGPFDEALDVYIVTLGAQLQKDASIVLVSECHDIARFHTNVAGNLCCHPVEIPMWDRPSSEENPLLLDVIGCGPLETCDVGPQGTEVGHRIGQEGESALGPSDLANRTRRVR